RCVRVEPRRLSHLANLRQLPAVMRAIVDVVISLVVSVPGEMRAAARIGGDRRFPGIEGIFAHGDLRLPRPFERPRQDAGAAVAVALPHYPESSAGVDRGPGRNVRTAVRDRLQLAPLGSQPDGDADLPCVADM